MCGSVCVPAVDGPVLINFLTYLFLGEAFLSWRLFSCCVVVSIGSVPHRLRPMNTWLPVSGAAWGGLGGKAVRR